MKSSKALADSTIRIVEVTSVYRKFRKLHFLEFGDIFQDGHRRLKVLFDGILCVFEDSLQYSNLVPEASLELRVINEFLGMGRRVLRVWP